MPAPARNQPLTLVHDRDRLEASEPDEELSPRNIPMDELYRRYAPYVAAVASRILGREGEVQDVVQDVFAAAVTGLRRRDEPNQARGWLATVTVRTSMRKLRARAFWSVFDLNETPQYERLADPSAGPEERQLVAEVYRALDELPTKERVAWVLRHVEGESLENTAALCGCSLATVKRRITRAHEAVREHLEGHREGIRHVD